MIDKMRTSKRNGTIDIYRIVAAILIVMIHYGTGFRPYAMLANTIGRLGVPIFFMITGYYFFKRQPTLSKHPITDRL